MDLRLLVLFIGFFASRSSALPITCNTEVSGLFFNNDIIYDFVATENTAIQPTTCGWTFSWDTFIEVRHNGVLLEFSDNLGNKVCPGTPQASAVAVHVQAGETYQIILKRGNLYQPGPPKEFSMYMGCSDPIEAYWASMFNNTNVDYAMLSCFNNMWFYNGQPTCVGKGQYWEICPFHFLHCGGDITFGYGSQQVAAVIAAVAQPDNMHPDIDGCPLDLQCSGQQYTCPNEVCVDQSKLCDGTNDCGDAARSDEDNGINLGLCDFVAPTPPPGDSLTDNFGCTDEGAVNYSPIATADDGSCEYCFDALGESLHLVTDRPSELIPVRCGLAGNGDLMLACRASQKYPVSIVSLLEPFTANQPFETEFIDQGRVVNTFPQLWTHSFGPLCTNEYDGVFKWDDLYKDDDSTILVRMDVGSKVIFTGFVALDMFEQLAPLRDVNLTRWMRQKLPFRLIFDTDVMVTSGEITIHDMPNDMFAIIEQTTVLVDGSASPPLMNADIILWSSVQYPYQLVVTGVSVNVPALANPELSVSLYEDCSGPANTPCNQKFLIHVALLNTCEFSGTYTVTFDVICGPNVLPEDCPLPAGGNSASVDFQIASEDVCPVIVAEVVALGSSRAFNVPRVGTQPYAVVEHNAYMINSMAYFEINVESVDGLVVETTITDIELCFDPACNVPTQIYANGAALIAALQLVVIDYPRNPLVSPLPTVSDIHIYLDDSVFNVPFDESMPFHMNVDLEVLYYNTATLLEAGAERDYKTLSVEAMRDSPKARKLHLTSTAQKETLTVDINSAVISGNPREVVSDSSSSSSSSSGADQDNRNIDTGSGSGIDDSIGAVGGAGADSGATAAAQASYVFMVAITAVAVGLTAAIWR